MSVKQMRNEKNEEKNVTTDKDNGAANEPSAFGITDYQESDKACETENDAFFDGVCEALQASDDVCVNDVINDDFAKSATSDEQMQSDYAHQISLQEEVPTGTQTEICDAMQTEEAVVLKNEITEGKLFPSLIKFTIPLMLSLLVQALYSMVDLIIVGQYGTSASVSSVSIGGQLMHTVTVVISGVTMGGTVLIGRYYGAKNYERAAKAVGNLCYIGAVTAVILTAISAGCAQPIARALNVPGEAFNPFVDYVSVCGGGVIFIVAYNLFSAVFRGVGNSKLPFVIVLVASVVNVVLDMLFVGVFKMDALGAAIATVIAQGVSVLSCAIIYKIKKLPFKLCKSDFKFDKKLTGDLLKIGSPIALQDGLTSISFLLISAFINQLGVVASASVGIAERMYLFLIIVPMSFMSTIATFVAQNTGADKPKRALDSMVLSIAISAAFGVGICLFTYFGADIIARMFTTDTEVIASCADYLHACAFEYLLTSVFYCLIGYFNGRGKTVFTMTQGILVAFAVRVPISYAFTHIQGVSMFKIGTAVPISAAVSTVLCLGYFVMLTVTDKRKIRKNRVGTLTQGEL